jgi:hypothetical protein
VTETTWRELPETPGDGRGSSSPSLAVEFRNGAPIVHEEVFEFKQERDRLNRAFLGLIQKHTQIVPVIASLDPASASRSNEYSGITASKPNCVLWSNELVQGQIAVTEFGARRAWTRIVIAFLADLGSVQAKERDIATAKLIGMDCHTTCI